MGQERRPVTISRCMKLFSRQLIVDNMKYCDPSIRMGEDVNITLPALLDAERIVIMKDAAWYHYRYLTDSMAHAYDDGLFENIRRLYTVMEKIMQEKKAPDAILQAQRVYPAHVFRGEKSGERKPEGLERAPETGMQGRRAPKGAFRDCHIRKIDRKQAFVSGGKSPGNMTWKQ